MTATATSYRANLMPPRIPIDPLDLERMPPEDVDDCVACGGVGAIRADLTTDPADVDVCPVCQGDGVIL